MENILNLKTYNKYLNLINEGLLLIPDNNLTDIISDVNKEVLILYERLLNATIKYSSALIDCNSLKPEIFFELIAIIYIFYYFIFYSKYS